MNKSVNKSQKIILFSIVIFFTFVYLLFVITNHYLFETFCFDYGFFNYNFYQFAHLNYAKQVLYNPPLQGYFSNHMAFIFPFISILYWPMEWIFGTYTLLIIQVIIMVLGSIYTYKLILFKSGNFWFAIILMFCSFIILGKYSAMSADYMDTIIGASLLPIFIFYFEKRKFLLSSILFMFILFAKENMALMLLFLSLTLLIHYKRDKQLIRVCSIYAIVSLLYFIIVFTVLIPAFEDPHYSYYGFQYSVLGKNPFEALKFILSHPFKTIELMFINHKENPEFDGIKAEMYWFFLLCGGLLLLRNPVWILPFIPLIGQKVFSDGYVKWGLNSFYMIEIVNLLPIAVYYSISKIKLSKLKGIILILLLTSTTLMTFVKFESRKSKYYLIYKEKIYDKRFYKVKFNIKRIHSYLDNIPKDVAVSATESLVPHLAYRDKIYCFPTIKDADMLIILKDQSTYPLTKEQFDEKLRLQMEDPDWKIIVDDYPLLIFQKL